MYKCVCGKKFDNPQSFNGHKAHCKQHYLKRDGNIEALKDLHTRQGISRASTILSKRKESDRKSKDLLTLWISEQHKCERCGVVMESRFGSGRFCSRACANSHDRTDESKLKTSLSLKKIGPRGAALTAHLHRINNHTSKLQNSICKVCGNNLDESRLGCKTCSDACKRKLLSEHAKRRKFGGPSEVSSFGKRGTYHGVHCDSTYELAFLIYCLDNNIKIERNVRSFPYKLEGKIRNYYPDFYLSEQDLYIETKGRDIGPVYEKINAVLSAGCQIKILHYEDLKPYFDYVCKKYNVYHSLTRSTIASLYDENTFKSNT